MIRVISLGIFVILLTLGIYSASQKKCDVLSYKCVGCGDCVKLCPKDAIELKRGKAVIDPDMCIGCRQCLYVCSFNAIRVYDNSGKLARFKTAGVKK